MLYLDFDRASCGRGCVRRSRSHSAPPISSSQGLNESVSLDEVGTIYPPLSRLLNLHVAATQTLHRPATRSSGRSGGDALRHRHRRQRGGGEERVRPVLRAPGTLAGSSPRRLITTDGFLLPNRVLEERGLLHRKGFPESYDVRRLVEFMNDIKSADAPVRAPVYSHQSYDIVPGQFQVVDRPDIVIVEGLNVLQTGDGHSGRPARVFVSDFFDFSIYIDADEADVEAWYIARFLKLRETIFRDPASYFHRYAGLSDDEAVSTAREIWHTINGVNLRENIAPTRERARLILEKGADHAVKRVGLRRRLAPFPVRCSRWKRLCICRGATG
jgi:type I pantothenate kinase